MTKDREIEEEETYEKERSRRKKIREEERKKRMWRRCGELFARDLLGFLRRYSQSVGIVLKEKLPVVKTSLVADMVHRVRRD